MDPAGVFDITGFIASVVELWGLGSAGIKTLAKRFPEFGRFWESFEALLRDNPGVSGQDLDDLCYREPEFQALIIAFMDSRPEARGLLEEHFRSFVAEAALPDVMRALEDAASRAEPDEKRRQLRAHRELMAEIRQALDEVRGVREELAENTLATHETLEMARRIEAKVDAQTGAQGDSSPAPISEKQVERLLQQQSDKFEARAQELQQEQFSRLERVVLAERERPARTATPQVSIQPRVQERLDLLRQEEPESAETLDALIAGGGILQIAREIRQGLLRTGTVALLVAAGRIVLTEGLYADAERAFLEAAAIADNDRERARQFVRAAQIADMVGDAERYEKHLAQAKRLSDDLAAIAITEARRSRNGQFMLTRLQGVEADSDEQRAVLHQTRAQAHLALGDEAQARAELALAQEADPNNVSVREFEAILPWHTAQLVVARGERPAPAPLVEAAERFIALAEESAREGRRDEVAIVRARAAEAYQLAGDVERALAELERIDLVESLSLDAQLAMGRAAMVCQRADLVLRFVPESATETDARLQRAEAQAFSSEPASLEAARPVLNELLDSGSDDIAAQAAFGLLVATTNEAEAEWPERAARLVAERKPESEAALRAEWHLERGEIEKAEAALLPFAMRPMELRRLRDYAAAREDWPRVVERARAVLRLDATTRDRLALAEALFQIQKLDEAANEFLRIARDATLELGLREVSFSRAVTAIGQNRDYEAVRTLAREWLDNLPESTDASWNLALASLRLGEPDAAYGLVGQASIADLTDQQSLLLAEVLHRAAPPAEALARLVELSDRAGRQVEAFEALIIVTSMRSGLGPGEIPESLESRIRASYEEFADRFPDSATIQMIEAPESAEEFLSLIREMHGDSPELQREAHEGIARGTTPVSLLAAAATKGVGESWARLDALPLALCHSETDEQERVVAASSFGGSVVWDSASLYVVGLLAEATANVLINSLPGSSIVNETLEDADRDTLMSRRGEAETFSDHLGNVGVREIAEKERAGEKQRIAATLKRAKRFEVQPAKGAGLDDELFEAYEAVSDRQALAASLASIMLAKRTGRALYSDDRALRALARGAGIEAFGSLDLLRVAVERGALDEAALSEARRTLMRRGVWGVLPTGAELVKIAQEASFQPSDLLEGALRDRAAWRGQPASMLGRIVQLLAASFAENPELLPVWLERTIDAGQRCLPEMDRAWLVEMLLMMAWNPTEELPPISRPAFHALIEAVKRLPTRFRRGTRDPIGAALLQLWEMTDEQPPADRINYMRQLAHALRTFDQLTVLQQFVLPFLSR